MLPFQRMFSTEVECKNPPMSRLPQHNYRSLVTRTSLVGLFLVVCPLLGLSCTAPQAPQANVTITEEVLLANPVRLGVNLGPETYYGDQQYLENPLLHGGFSKGHQSLIVRTKAGTADSFTDADFNAADKDRRLARELTGGRYYVATGPRAGESGAITAHELTTGTYFTEKSSAAFAAEDYVWLRGPDAPHGEPEPEDTNVEKGLGIGDFRVIGDEGVELSFAETLAESRDQAISIILPPENEVRAGGVKHYLRVTAHTGYRVRLRARSVLPDARISVSLVNLAIESGEDRTVSFDAPLGAQLSSEWRDYLFEARTSGNTAIETNFSALEIVGVAKNSTGAPASIEIDDLRVEDLHLQSDTAFSKQIVETLKEAQVGTLRFYNVFDIALPTDAVTASTTTDAPWTFLSLASGYRLGQASATVSECLGLAREVGARPWLTLGNGNTPDDWYALISYLTGPAALDVHSQRRAAQGRPEPWTESFDTIYLEIGNEWWNPIFYPFHVSHPEKYGEICRQIIARVRQHPNYDPNRIKLVVGGWAINAHNWNGVVDATSNGQDFVSVAPYLLHELDTSTTPMDKYGALFASVDAHAAEGGEATRAALAANKKNTRLAVYELNTHLTGGAAPENVASEICSSAAAGVAVLDQALSLMTNFGASPVNYFVLLQRDYNGRLGLWGNLVRENSGDLRSRPVWHGLRLANNYFIQGDLVRATVEGGGSWHQPANGSVPEITSVPNLHAYASISRDPSSNGRRANLLLINRSISSPVRAAVTLPFTPSTSAKAITLNGNNPADNNEEAEHVRLQESSIHWPRQGTSILLPPCSATVLQFSE